MECTCFISININSFWSALFKYKFFLVCSFYQPMNKLVIIFYTSIFRLKKKELDDTHIEVAHYGMFHILVQIFSTIELQKEHIKSAYLVFFNA